jgi:pimeloyl-ACP methyl ester carboxylesterase
MTQTPTYLDREIRVRDVTLHYQEWGDASAPTVLMLHGFGVSGHMFDEFAARAQGMYHLIALDQRGHGDSEWAPDGDYSRDTFIADVEAFREAMKLEPFLLVGHSMGGLNSAAYAAKYPDHVRALVLVDVGPEAAKDGVDNIMRFTRGPDELEFNEFVENALRFNPRRTRENIEERMRHRLKPMPSGKWTWKFDKRFREQNNGLRIGSEATNEEVWAMFRAITCPVLLVRGEQSDVLKQDVAERCASELADCKLVVVPSAGHSVPGDNPDGFTEPVLEFFEQHAHETETEPPATGITESEDGPTLQELVASNHGGSRRPGALTLFAVGAGAAITIGALVALNRSSKKKQQKAQKPVISIDEPTGHHLVDVDEARARAMHLAGDLSVMARSGASRARARLGELEVDQARENALEIARILGERSEEAIRTAVASPRSKAARQSSVKAAKSGGSTGLTALRWGVRLISLAAMSGVGRKPKNTKSLSGPSGRRLLPWRG